jgi:hypothetical protein
MTILSVPDPAHDNNCRFLSANFTPVHSVAIEINIRDRSLSFGNLLGN